MTFTVFQSSLSFAKRSSTCVVFPEASIPSITKNIDFLQGNTIYASISISSMKSIFYHFKMTEDTLPNIADMDTTLGIMQVAPDDTGAIASLHPEAPQEMHFGEEIQEEETESKDTVPNQKELGYMRIEELIGSGKLSIETAE